jgi:hypothetical protein
MCPAVTIQPSALSKTNAPTLASTAPDHLRAEITTGKVNCSAVASAAENTAKAATSWDSDGQVLSSCFGNLMPTEARCMSGRRRPPSRPARSSPSGRARGRLQQSSREYLWMTPARQSGPKRRQQPSGSFELPPSGPTSVTHRGLLKPGNPEPGLRSQPGHSRTISGPARLFKCGWPASARGIRPATCRALLPRPRPG